MTIHGVVSYARMYVLLVYMKDTLFSTVRNFFILTAFTKKKPCHAGRMISVVYSECEYVTRRRLNYVRAKYIVTSLTSVKMKALHKSGRVPKPGMMNRWHRCQVWHRMKQRQALVIIGYLSVNMWSNLIIQ